MGKDEYLPLFETRVARGRIVYLVYAVSVMIGICAVFVYRATHLPAATQAGRWAWMGLFMAEVWFTLYWLITQSVRWTPIYRYTFKDRHSQRYEKVLPKVDILVCTADHTVEPPIMVVNTILSLMAYDYPTHNLSVYLSDDGGSEFTFYALLEASHFSKYWLPFSKKFKIEPRSPSAYFSKVCQPLDDPVMAQESSSIKTLYEDMKKRIDDATKLGQIPEQVRKEHKGFQEWDWVSSKYDHPTILQVILIDGRDPKAVDIEQEALPTLVYLAREKRPQYHHNFKAGALNALLRVSSRISNGPVILNVDCDMYSNNSESLRDALCFLMDEEQSRRIAFVQFPQNFDNLTKNDVYSSSLRIISEVELPGLDANGGPLYIGTGCFHKRVVLCGRKYSKDEKIDWSLENHTKVEESTHVLEETCKILASCTYEENTEWGKEMGLMYGCPVEDVMTGLAIQCRGWRSVGFNPVRKGFLGLAPTTLLQTLVQHQRWSEGDLQIFLSKYCPLIYGRGKIPLKHQISYCCYLLWAPNCLATLYYVVVPSLCIHRGISLFPKLSSPWVLPFVYVILAKYGYSLGEFLCCGGTFQEWWNDQRMWVFKRTTSYLFAFTNTILKLLGFAKAGFALTAKVADEDVSLRYEQEIMEFGAPSPMLNILATISLANLFSFVGALKMVIMDSQFIVLDLLALQILLCGLVVLINLPVYEGLFFRKDKGRMPTSIVYKSVIIAVVAHILALH
ncbi:Cellulose synthase-like protein [Actinidia chinensis var. chinensis]|uniref:Cellulose synthase-like protein n=1 Tax=Actinidia chinensis var. chinensis TaxID=1590841 RepID=A0A2R6RB26_ACTCC|nr:Cellulose synthase-like protein [Actinidia chinensis var. chinensis]